MPQSSKISISIVSHLQAGLLNDILHDLQAYCDTPLEVILTLNVPEPLAFDVSEFKFPVHLIRNDHIKGFAANHNAAFRFARSDLFCVLNPDVRLEQDPFPYLNAMLSNPTIGVAAPLILNFAGEVEGSARKFPTPLSIFHKLLMRRPLLDYPIGDVAVFPDWVAGMFMIFRAELYQMIGGFDEGYFLYYEDVDICWRLRRHGYDVALLPSVQVTHAARRTSHQDLQFLVWHVSSMLRFFTKRALEYIGY